MWHDASSGFGEADSLTLDSVGGLWATGYLYPQPGATDAVMHVVA
jgi:hypothetical protein